ncbi:MAG: hypothetical protein KAQ68_03680, partial [Clostridiales bacterium]|nr:hypothetical protein [Clostridiales bacterium]
MDSKLFTYKDLGQDKLDYIFSILKKLRVGLLGDVSLDVYWQADMKKSELSRETPHFPLPIVQERMSPGAGGNVAANIKALGVASIKVVSVIGNDWRANALLDEFQKRGINTSLIIRSDQLTTNAYCKPIRSGISEVEYEDPRLDFANYETLPEEEEEKLLHNIDLLSKNVDV